MPGRQHWLVAWCTWWLNIHCDHFSFIIDVRSFIPYGYLFYLPFNVFPLHPPYSFQDVGSKAIVVTVREPATTLSNLTHVLSYSTTVNRRCFLSCVQTWQRRAWVTPASRPRCSLRSTLLFQSPPAQNWRQRWPDNIPVCNPEYESTPTDH